jgi:hypothetical protein
MLTAHARLGCQLPGAPGKGVENCTEIHQPTLVPCGAPNTKLAPHSDFVNPYVTPFGKVQRSPSYPARLTDRGNFKSSWIGIRVQ